MSNAVLDHVGIFAPDSERADRALQQLGFTVTPFTIQRNLVGDELVPAGTGNRLVVLESGYLEILSPTGEDTPLARQFHEATQRYHGVHLITFAEDDIAEAHRRLEQAGFDPAPIVDLQREVETATARATARFEVLRVAAGRMEEARVQICRHHTPELVWQSRWLTHANAATELLDVMVVVDKPNEAARRYAAFTGSVAELRPYRQSRVTLESGALVFVDPDRFAEVFGEEAPAVPSVGAVALRSSNLTQTRRWLDDHEIATTSPASTAIRINKEDALGCWLEMCATDTPESWSAPRSVDSRHD